MRDVTPDLHHRYGFRAWLRQRLPWWLIDLGVAGKGRDCERRGAEHHWYNIDDASSGCYYCRVVEPGRLWERPPLAPMHELDVVRVLRVSKSAETENPRPQVGEEGTVVSIDRRTALVERVAPDGYTIWLATFDRADLEVIWCAEEPS